VEANVPPNHNPEIFDTLIEGSLTMNEPNAPISLYQGPFLLFSDKGAASGTGQIEFNWSPAAEVRLSGSLDDLEMFDKIVKHGENQLFIGDEMFGTVYLWRIVKSKATQLQIEGIFIDKATIGDVSIPVSSIRFAVPNLVKLQGTTVCRSGDKPNELYNNRLTLNDNKFSIKIDARYCHSDLSERLHNRGGYVITYYGQIEKTNESINHAEAKEVLERLGDFLTFVNGFRTNAIFLEGLVDNNRVWADLFPQQIDAFNFDASWYPTLQKCELSDLWAAFNKLWEQPNAKSFLKLVVQWYIEAKSPNGSQDGKIMLGQAGLELLYNWWICERKKLIRGKDKQNITAANKIRLLLSFASIDFLVPPQLEELAAFGKSVNCSEGPDIIVYLRNKVTHADEDDRGEISSIPKVVKMQVIALSVFYIELLLLRILDYDGMINCTGDAKNKFPSRPHH